MLDTGWGSQEVMPALQKDNIPLVPRCGPGAPSRGFSPSWPWVEILTLADPRACSALHSRLGSAAAGFSVTLCGGRFGCHSLAFSAPRPGLLPRPSVLAWPALWRLVLPQASPTAH